MLEVCLILGIVLGLLVILTLIIPGPASNAAEALLRCINWLCADVIGGFFASLVASPSELSGTRSFSAFGSSVRRRMESGIAGSWTGLRHSPAYRWPIPLLVALVLAPTLYGALLVESWAIQRTLQVIFIRSNAQATSYVEQSFGATDITPPHENSVREPSGSTMHQESGQNHESWLMPFFDLWQKPLGFMAVGLAALQAALGLLFLWNTGESSVEKRLSFFWYERRMTFVLFLLLDLTLAALGFVRGAVVAGGWGLRAVFAGLLALSMPWAAAYIVHFLFEALCVILVLAEVLVMALGSIGITLAVGGVALGAVGAGWLVIAVVRWIAEFLRELPSALRKWPFIDVRTQCYAELRKIRGVKAGNDLYIEAQVPKTHNSGRRPVYRWSTPPGHGDVTSLAPAAAAVYKAPPTPGIKLVVLESLDGKVFSQAFAIAVFEDDEESRVGR